MNKSIITSAVALAFILGGCSESKTVEQLIISGNDFVQIKDFSSAVIEFKNAVRLEPNSAQARLALARAYLEQGNYLNAEKELSRALALGIDFSNIAALMAIVNTRLDRPNEVYKLVERSNDLADDEYIQVLTYAGISALKQNDIAQGEDYLTQAIAINKEAVYSQIAQAYLYYAARDFSQGLITINHLLTENAAVSEALLIQGHLYYALGEFEHSSDTFALYLTYHPQAHSIRFLEVNSLIKAEKFEQANVLTDTLLSVFKDSPLALQFKAQLEYQKKNYSGAREYAEKALQHGKNLVVAKIIAGVSSYFLGDVEQAYTRLNAIVDRVPNNALVKKILAVTKFELGYYTEAAENFSSLEGLTAADIQLLKNSSTSLMAIGEFDSALTLINKAEKLAPDSAELAAKKGLMLLSQNDVSAIGSLERAIKLDPSLPSTQVALALEYLKRGQEDKAKEIALNYQKRASSAHIGHVLEGFIYLNKKQNDSAKISFEKALVLEPNNIASLYNLGQLHKDLKQASKAISYFDQVLQLSPEHKGALKALVALAEDEKIISEVLAVLIINDHAGNLYNSIALAQVLRTDKQVERAITKLEAIEKSAQLTSNYFILLGDSYLQLNKHEEANTVFVRGLALEPSNYFLNFRYINTLEWLGYSPLALEQLRKFHGFYKNNTNVTASLVYFETKNKNYKKAKSLLKSLKDQRSDHHLLDVAAGEIYSYEKNYAQAMKYFSAAYDKKPTELNLLNLARTLKFNKQNKEAEAILELYLEKHPKSSKIRFLLAELYSAENRKKKVAQYLVLSSQVPNNAIVLNNLAWNQFKLGQGAKALINIEKAYKLQPDNLAIQESYGVILVENNDLIEGINMLEQAIKSGSIDSNVKGSWRKAKALLDSAGNPKAQQ